MLWQYLSQQTWVFISFFLFIQTTVPRYSAKEECTDLPWPWHSDMSIVVFRQCLGCTCSATGIPLAVTALGPLPCLFFQEKATLLYFHHSLILCGFTRRRKFYFKACNVCIYGKTLYTGARGHRAVCSPISCPVGACHISCMKYGCQSVIDLLITVFTNDSTFAFVVFCYSFINNLSWKSKWHSAQKWEIPRVGKDEATTEI